MLTFKNNSMKLTLFTALASLSFAASAQSGNIIQTKGAQRAAYVQEAGCFQPQFTTYEEWSEGSEHFEAQMMHSGEQLMFWHDQDWGEGWNVEWHLDRLTGPGLPHHQEFFVASGTQTIDHISGTNNPYFDKYLISLYREHEVTGVRVLLDWEHLYVFANQLGEGSLFTYGFDAEDMNPNGSTDDLGHKKITGYPEFAGSANRRSDMHIISEKLKGKCFFPAFAVVPDSASSAAEPPRLGDGYVAMVNPNTERIAGVEQPSSQICEGENAYTYDYCEDICDIHSESIAYQEYDFHSQSLCSEVSLDVHPFGLQGESTQVGFSFRIPSNFDETGLVDPYSGELSQARFQALAEFKQQLWPISNSQFPRVCNPMFQLLYLGDGLIGLRYGLAGYNQVCLGPWAIEKGQWVDVAIDVLWEPAHGGANLSEAPGKLELWMQTEATNFQRMCLTPVESDFLTPLDMPTGLDQLTLSTDAKTLTGPNMMGVNPAFFSLMAKRGVPGSGICGFDFQTEVHFDELRVGDALDDVLTQGTGTDQAEFVCTPDIPYELRNGNQVLSSDRSLRVYPNPAVNDVHVNFPEWFVPLEVYVVDIGGRKVMQASSTKLDARPLELDVSHLNPGVYHVIAIGANEMLSSQLQVGR